MDMLSEEGGTSLSEKHKSKSSSSEALQRRRWLAVPRSVPWMWWLLKLKTSPSFLAHQLVLHLSGARCGKAL